MPSAESGRTPFRIVVLVSGGGTNLQAVMDRIADGQLPAVRICGVIASRENTRAQTRAEQAGIACKVVSRKSFADIHGYDQAMLEAISPWQPDLIVLAGFLSLLGPGLVSTYKNRIINVHPSLIPAFSGPGMYGIRPHEAALAYGVKISGASVHVVDEHYDQGPIVLQKAVAIKQDDTPESLQQRIMKMAEQVILPQAIQLFSEGRVRIDGRKTFIKEDPS